MNANNESKYDYSKIVVAHPEQQHSFRVAEALRKEGLLYKYITTVYNKDDSFLMRLAKLFLNKDNLRRANKRRMANLSDTDVIQFCEFGGFLFLLLLRIDKKRKFAPRVQKHVSERFQKKVARFIIDNKVGVVISYDLHSDVLFQILMKEAPSVIRIIDDAHPNRNCLYEIYKQFEEQSGEFKKTHNGMESWLLDKDLADSYGHESRMADLHIVASSFSKSTVKYNGFCDEQIIVAPYGVNGTTFKPGVKDYEKGLKVLFVGSINQRKGISQILEAAKALDGEEVSIVLVGSGRQSYPELYKPYEQYVTFKDWVPFEELTELYATSHVFIFPSMGEGFGLVLLEALSAGLPLISSRNCGGPDFVEEGYNGFLIDAGDAKQLEDRIRWLSEHMEVLPQMQTNAIESARKMTWERYESILTSCLKEKINMISVDKLNAADRCSR